ncbi:MAG: PAS domain S-box-containing protein [Algoriphagus sp.]|jgi:PAS domain S-box-containing protein
MKQLQEFSENFSVLIIEDNQGDYVLIEDYLLEKFKKINIIHCPDYATSINYLQNSKEKTSIILLDLHLPDLGGIELINSIIPYSFKAPIIILTGYSDLDMAKSSLQAGIYDYLVKDEINPDILYKTIIFSLNRSHFINEIENEKHNYEDLFNFNPQPTWLLDLKSYKIISANIAAQQKYGYALDDFLKMSFTQLHPQEEKQRLEQKFTSKDDEIEKNHFTHLLGNGKEIKVKIYFRKIKSDSDTKLIVQSNDISETLDHIYTIELQNEKLKNIAWTQSHMVRAPLSRILGIVNLIEQQKDTLDDKLFWLKQLRVSTNEMDAIVKKIIDETKHLDQN